MIEEVEYYEYEEEVWEEEDDEEVLIVDDSPDTTEFYKYAELNTCIFNYCAIRPYNEIFYSKENDLIIIKLLTNVLPYSLQSILNLGCSPILLEIRIRLSDYDWCKPPKLIKVEHPVYKSHFVGINLVKGLFERFFSQNYKVKEYYRSKPFLLASKSKYDKLIVNEITGLGFTENQANSALEQVNGKLQDAINLLRTGLLPTGYSMKYSSSNPLLSYSDCPILYLVLEIVDIYLDLTDHCCICRKPLIEPTIKPTLCEGEMCRSLFESIGIGTTVLQEIKRDPIVADLLLTMFSTAIGHFLDPAPPKFSIQKMISIFNELPSVDVLRSFNSDQELCQRIGIDAYELIKWILLTNKSHFLALPNELKINEINARFQFLTLISSVQKEEEFKKLKQKYGSIYLWHGSGSDRWYSILRNGLKNCSGTKLMKNGNRHGDGIYFAKHIGISSCYMHQSQNVYKASKLSVNKNFNMIALCEVINDEKYLTEHSNFCHTLTNEKLCIVRFLFINVKTAEFNTLVQKFKRIPALSDVLNYYADEGKRNSDNVRYVSERLDKEIEI
ncbi:UBA/TS-N domain containing protein [Trichomonas vaginalis G3]|uniref:UBA/TS-N domain containing protein n=1 Tax=Trichomonas vaginalis (strain ATCC PRA-98 / G3) TaxID=412133 RepID=A2GCI1_TRIV3|nr:poly ADP-ribose polymerase family, member PARP family [Trichomonas vaginalis G3]EAX85134.1 UBA/TS-N domain containing protein [Trichomonas vaginalis G3]KAI5511910.1 poly ADP-ribose polymerase family, member PARP family [Trichomonas vaginalis G3]|eukprot:XP_001298064.1 UBA/TS-N domain containing protein [Trichomonas vaginalis G3]